MHPRDSIFPLLSSAFSRGLWRDGGWGEAGMVRGDRGVENYKNNNKIQSWSAFSYHHARANLNNACDKILLFTG